ncbi:MEDS domain-containing protein [Pseudonocardia sp. RS11V-5]|uniref:MEDS domain-containing protein n=1 Tax=Pseudonocardia terrae TaxID=2905831 RepID=UPI001E41ED5F|nr:MEDS domain-containing protein [Pseudonocardia terrae]MCE3552502.1 MEDS domain-containing protein [Pseudonocardia terrae]
MVRGATGTAQEGQSYPGRHAASAAELAGVAAELGAGVRPGAVEVVAVRSVYGADAVVEPEAQVRTYAAATNAAVADGFTGLRVAAEITTLVRTTAQRDAFARYEQRIDRFMTRHPFSAVCAYDREVLGVAALAELACVHPAASPGATPFRFFARDGVDAVLGGEIDRTARELLARTLDRAELAPRGDELVVDAAELGFLDHRGLLLLDELGHREEAVVALRDAPAVVGRMAALLGLARIRVDTVGTTVDTIGTTT